jgi:hypothetical protein
MFNLVLRYKGVVKTQWLDAWIRDPAALRKSTAITTREIDQIHEYLKCASYLICTLPSDSVEGASEVSDVSTSDREPSMEGSRLSLKAAADSFAPKEDEWSSWEN